MSDQTEERMSEHLLPVRTGTEQMPISYKQLEITVEAGSNVTCISRIIAVRDATLFILHQNNYNRYASETQNGYGYFETMNLYTGQLSYYGYATLSGMGNSYAGDMLVDDKYIYLSSCYYAPESRNQPKITILKRTDRVPGEPVGALSRVGVYVFSDGAVAAFGKMDWYDEDTICIMSERGLLLFDIHKHVFYEKPRGTNYPCYSFAVGKKLVLATRNSTSSPHLLGYRRGDGSFFTQDLPTNSIGVVTYEDGKFYIANNNYLYVYDEDTETIEKTCNVPWSSPTDIRVYHKTVYVLTNNSTLAYVYDSAYDNRIRIYLPWTIPTTVANSNSVRITRACNYEGYWFATYYTLMIADYTGFSKYNFGHIYKSFTVFCNETTEQTFTYDPRFITFYETYVSFHDGDITYQLEALDENPLIKSAHVSKSDYKFLNKAQFDSI